MIGQCYSNSGKGYSGCSLGDYEDDAEAAVREAGRRDKGVTKGVEGRFPQQITHVLSHEMFRFWHYATRLFKGECLWPLDVACLSMEDGG